MLRRSSSDSLLEACLAEEALAGYDRKINQFLGHPRRALPRRCGSILVFLTCFVLIVLLGNLVYKIIHRPAYKACNSHSNTLKILGDQTKVRAHKHMHICMPHLRNRDKSFEPASGLSIRIRLSASVRTIHRQGMLGPGSDNRLDRLAMKHFGRGLCGDSGSVR